MTVCRRTKLHIAVGCDKRRGNGDERNCDDPAPQSDSAPTACSTGGPGKGSQCQCDDCCHCGAPTNDKPCRTGEYRSRASGICGSNHRMYHDAWCGLTLSSVSVMPPSNKRERQVQIQRLPLRPVLLAQ